VVAIGIGRQTRPGEKPAFPRIVLWSWLALFVLLVAYLFTGLWYRESGTNPQDTAANITLGFIVALVALLAVYVGLYFAVRPRRRSP